MRSIGQTIIALTCRLILLAIALLYAATIYWMTPMVDSLDVPELVSPESAMIGTYIIMFPFVLSMIWLAFRRNRAV